MYILDGNLIPISVSEGEIIYYNLRSVHRRHGNDEKCIWTIPIEHEVDCFQYAASEKWLENSKGWGLKINIEKSLDQVGVSEQNEPLKIAKFVDRQSNNEWYGYPADYRRRKQDRPSLNILMDWKKKGIITKTQMDKIKQYKKCNL